MAKLPTSARDRHHKAFKLDENEDVARIVYDAETHRLLGNITGAQNTTPTISNVTIASANVEQSLALPANTKNFMIKTRGNHQLKLSYVSTESGTKYVTIPKNGVFTDDNFYTSQTLYFQSPSAGAVVEVVAYA